MNKSESIKNFADAMAKFQGEVKNPPKSADNPFFKSKYTTLDVLIDTAKPLLQKNGLSYLQSCSGDGQNIIVTTLLMHSSGEWVESDPLTLKADKATAQGAGSAITYARRYALAAALGLASDEDDDGNGAEGNGNKKSQKPTQQPNNTPPTNNTPSQNKPATGVISEAQAKRLFAISHGNSDKVKEIIGKHGYTSTKDIKLTDYETIAKEIEA
jgi:hypothetical protein